MFQLRENLIRELAGETNIVKANAIVLDGKIEDINASIFVDKKYELTITDINANIKSINDETCSLEIGFNNKSGIMHYKCDCAAYVNYSNRNICEHLAAALLKFMVDEEQIIRKSRFINSKRTLSTLDKMYNDIENHTTLLSLNKRLVVRENNTNRIYIELGIYDKKKFVVKNLLDFIKVNALKSGKVEFSRTFIFTAKKYYFNVIDKKLIDFMIDIFDIENAHQVETKRDVVTLSSFCGKKLYLTELQLKKVLELLKNDEFELCIDNEEFKDVYIKQSGFPISFNLKCDDKEIILEQSSAMPKLVSEDGEYFFLNGILYRLDNKTSLNYVCFYRGFQEEKSHKLYFDIEDKNKFAKLVYPIIKEMDSDVNLDGMIKEKIIEEELAISTYFDKHNDDIIASVKYIYGDKIVCDDKEKTSDENDVIVIRNIYKEKEFERTILNAGFTYDNGFYKLIKNEDILFEFLESGFRELSQLSAVYLSEEFKKVKVVKNISYKGKIGLKDKSIMELELEVHGISGNELKEIYREFKKKKRYYRFIDGSILRLNNESVTKISELFQNIEVKENDIANGKIEIPTYNAQYIEDFINKNDIKNIKKGNDFYELIANLSSSSFDEEDIPQNLRCIMRGYQKQGFNWLKKLSSAGMGGILADEMGLGKTLQTIAFISYEVSRNLPLPFLIIVPASLIYNWENEILKFAPNLKTLVVSGNKETRLEFFDKIQDYHVIITSYPLIRRDIDNYLKLKFSYCILDEAQYIKNFNSMNSKFVKKIKAGGYFALTGTPIENSLSELWSIFDFILPGYLFSYSKFVKKYELPIIKNNDSIALAELNKKIGFFILRREKSEVISELPPKIQHTIRIEMTDEQKIVYYAYLNEAKNILEDEFSENGVNKGRLKILALLTRLRQICSDPSVFIDNYKGDSGKMIALEELIDESVIEGHRILVFSQFTTVLKNIMVRLNGMNIEYLYFDGHTKLENRIKMVDDFNQGKGSVFLISLKAGGTGLNLTGADIVIHFDPWWNPAVENQATDRAHRIGQNKTVEVIKLVARGSIEEKILDLQEKKKLMVDNVISNRSEENRFLSEMSIEEIKELFN